MKKYWPLTLGVVAILLGSFYVAQAAGCNPFVVAIGGTGACNFSPNSIIVSGATPTTALSATSTQPLYVGSIFATTTATSTLTGGLNVLAINQTGSASSTFNNGIQLATGCFRMPSGTCLSAGGSGTVTNIATTFPILGGPITTTGTLTFGGLSTSSPIAAGAAVLYATGVNTVASAATTSLTATGVVSLSNPISVIGGSASALTITGGTNGQVLGWLSGAPTWTASSSVAAGTGTSISVAGAVTTVTNTGVISLGNGTGINCSGTNPGSCSIAAPVSIANGGTNATSFGTSNGVVAYDGTRLVNFSSCTVTTSLFTCTNASTTNLNASQSAGLPVSATCTNFFSGSFCLDSTNNQIQSGTGAGTSAINDPRRFITFSYATSTAWTGTTTLLAMGIAPTALTFSSVQCNTDTGTVNVQFQYGTGPTFPAMLNASTTIGTFTWTTSNTPAAGNALAVKVGTPASTPTSISCTISATVTAT